MHRFILSVTIAISLAAAAGCAARPAHSAVAPSVSVAASTAKDPSWCPPGEMEVSYGDAREGAARTEEATVMKPNSTERPNIGAVHAAVY